MGEELTAFHMGRKLPRPRRRRSSSILKGIACMDELAPIAYRQSLEIDWAAIGDATLRVTHTTISCATLLKASRHGDHAAFFARNCRQPPFGARVQRQGNITWLWQGPENGCCSAIGRVARAHLADERASSLFQQRRAAPFTAAALDVSDRLLSLEIDGPGARPSSPKALRWTLTACAGQLLPHPICGAARDAVQAQTPGLLWPHRRPARCECICTLDEQGKRLRARTVAHPWTARPPLR